MKSKRHTRILELIQLHEISTQEELSDYLKAEGYQVTQATVSRDIRELKLTKVSMGNAKPRYAAVAENTEDLKEKYNHVFQNGFVSMDMAQNILVINTVAGMAMAVAAALDALQIKEIVGSIAGDDTIMCAIRTAEQTKEVMKQIEEALGR